MRVLALCTHNSARSQIAEGWLRHHACLAQADFEVHSAGTEKTAVMPEAIEVMREVGIDLSQQTSKMLTALPDRWNFDVVWTLCDSANEACPVFPATTTRLHTSFRDPSRLSLETWREVRDAIGVESRRLIDALASGCVPAQADFTGAGELGST